MTKALAVLPVQHRNIRHHSGTNGTWPLLYGVAYTTSH